MTLAPQPVPTARQEEVLQAAAALFSHKGYEAASMRDLADMLQVKAASLYSHYASKEEILWSLALRCAEAFESRVLPLGESGGSVSLRLRAMLRAHLAVLAESRHAAAIFFREWEHLSEPRRSRYAAQMRAYRQAFALLIEAGIEAGELRPLSPALCADLLLAAANRLHRWQRPEGGLSPDAYAEALFGLFLQGLELAPEPAAPFPSDPPAFV
jgi:AcrR family transcriptional regulator